MKRDGVFYALILFGVFVFLADAASDCRRVLPTADSVALQASEWVVVDAGHGGVDGGTSGANGVVEKTVNLQIACKLQALIEFYGIPVRMTRESDESIHSQSADTIREKKVSDMKNRIALIRETENPTLLSIHLNFFPQPDCKGAQTFYSLNHPSGKSLAEEIQTALKSGLNDGNYRVAKPADASVYLMQQVSCPAVLIECGFLSNPEEESLLITDHYQTKLAACIAAGYLRFSQT